MSFDKDTRNLLARTITACRRRLIEDVTDQLRGVFGLHPDGTVLPLDKLTHLSPDQISAAQRLRDLLDHYTVAVGAPGKELDRRKVGYERMVLEISFTVLNRLAALRLCEERELVIECVRKGTTSAGFQMFERISGGALGGRYDAYRVFLECLFDELALDLGVLFDRMSPQSAVFPAERCMEDVLGELNKPELAHLWTEDETIGWIYQYFNPPEERKAMREASSAPRNSRELAVRNQFFTPRYVVEFLTDNTLGRIWYEMRKGETALKQECSYLIRRPNEVFLASGAKAPATEESETGLSQEELLKQPVYIAHRQIKDPRDIKMLDPACGSMHFGLYAFDLFECIYDEAWNLEARFGDDAILRPESLKSLHETYDSKEVFLRDVPRLIIEWNIHGIDIDPRAVQIASLSLWLRAQKTWKHLGIKAADRPRISRSNIVTAEPMPGEEDMRREFTAALKPRVLGQLVDIVFDKMKLAGEAGSLLIIEEEIKDTIDNARKQWLEGPMSEQQLLFPGMTDSRPKQQELRFDVKGITDERFWERAEEDILNALKEYAERAENGWVGRRRLFAEDAARGFAFIDLCRKHYDVVLMNPPFGIIGESSSDMVRREYPVTYSNLACAFHQRMYGLSYKGMLGAIVDISTLIRSSYEEYRRSVIYLKSSLSTLCLLGWNVLDDANVETCLITLSCMASSNRERVACYDLRTSDEKAERIKEMTSLVNYSWSNQKDFESLPNGVPAFYLPAEMQAMFSKHACLDPTYAAVCTGVSTGDNSRFYKLGWEIPNIGTPSGWKHLSNGGDYCPFYRPWTDVIDWRNDGAAIRNHNGAFIRNEIRFGHRGLTYGKRGNFLSVQINPAGRIITNEGQGIFPHSTENAEAICAILNSTLLQITINTYCGQHKENGYVKLLPIIEPTSPDKIRLKELARSGFELMRCLIARSIEHSESLIPALISVPAYRTESLIHSFSRFQANLQTKCAEANSIENEINKLVAVAYSLGESSKTFLEINSFGKAQLGTTITNQLPSLLNEIVAEALDYFIGVVLGRWDVRIAMDPSLEPKLADPFDPLPVCPPGMLVGPDGLPAESGSIVSEEWLLARPDANILPEGLVKISTIPNDGYPLRVSWDGILVDDPGFNTVQSHQEDIIRRVREVFDLLWKVKAHEIEQEACDVLGVPDIRDYFRRPTGFFQDHLKRYSKSRRKAPIYWPLSTASGAYTIWLYYHRLTDQTLYAAVNKYVEPKIAETERGIVRIENNLQTTSGREATRLNDRLGEACAFLAELRDLREELLHIAALPFNPDLNDGVIINAAPFHNLFRLRSWAKDTEECWKKLEKGDYDWAHLAYTIWPDRVREVCKIDRSVAITHGLENLYQEQPEGKKRNRKRKSGNIEESEEEV